jgi:hypothetical protein
MKPELEMMLARLRLPEELNACDVCHQSRPKVGRLSVGPWRLVCAECIDSVLEALGL